MSYTLIQVSRPIVRARRQSHSIRPFSIVVPARLENEWMHFPKLNGFLADKHSTINRNPNSREAAALLARRNESKALRRLQQQVKERRGYLEELPRHGSVGGTFPDIHSHDTHHQQPHSKINQE
ncbi:hypothetical protein BBP40_001305 [Aspergillus hancockii]|nr:hypothetical protein BBP40_001305 [Aspergillus hancockii]